MTHSINNGLHIEAVSSKAGLKDFIDVFKVGFGKENIANSFFENKFKQTSSSRFIGMLMYDSDANKAIGVFGVLGVKAMLNNEIIEIGQAVDLTIIPEYRKKGLFTPLHNSVMDKCKEEGLKLIFAFPNPASYVAFTNTGWKHEEDFTLLNNNLEASFLINKLRYRFPNLFNSYSKYKLNKHKLNDWPSKLPSGLISNEGKNLFVPRDKEYIEYKTNQGASLIKTKSGFSIVFIGKNEIKIGELFSKNPLHVLQELNTLFGNLGITKTSCIVSNNLKQNHPIFEGFKKNLQELPLTILALNSRDFAHSNFHFTGLEFDTFTIDYS